MSESYENTCVADVESKYLWDYFEKEKLDGIDLILSCGDLRSEYLSFLASFAKVPILYVRVIMMIIMHSKSLRAVFA